MKRFALLTLLCLIVATIGWSAQSSNPLALGSSAPEFKLKGVDGKFHTLDDYADAKLLAIIFTCNHCPTAQAYEERFKQLVTDYKSKGVMFVAISPNDPKSIRLDELGYTDLSDTFEEGVIRARDHKFNFPYLYDGDSQKVSKAYNPRSTPHVFIFDKERKLAYEGGIDDSERLRFPPKEHYVRDALDALLAGKEPSENRTATPGCSIKWGGKRGSVQASLDKWDSEEVTINDITADEVAKLMKNDTKKLLIINFWASWCGPCRIEFPDLVEIHRMYRHRDVELITISANTHDEKAKELKFLKNHHASSRNYIYAGDDLKELVQATNRELMGSIPVTIMVKPGGEIVYRHTGAIEPLEAKRAVVGVIGRTYK